MLLPILNSAPLSADLQHLTNKQSRAMPDTVRPNDLPLLVNASTYSVQRHVVGRLAALDSRACCRDAPCPDTVRPNDLSPLVDVSIYSEQRPIFSADLQRLTNEQSRAMSRYCQFQRSAHLRQCFYLFWTMPCCRQTCSAWLTSVLQSRVMSQIHSVPMNFPFWSILLPMLNGSLLSADLQRLTDERIAETRHVPDTLRPNDPTLHVLEMQR